MALTDTKLRNLKPTDKTFSVADGGGLYIEVSSTGYKSWKLRYRMGGRDAKQEKAALGCYPTYALAEARSWRDDCKALAGRGLSPMALKRGDPIPEDANPAAKELAQFFIRNWCAEVVEKARQQEAKAKASNTVETLAWGWFQKVVMPANKKPQSIKRALEKDILPAIGSKQLEEITVKDVWAITDKIKNRGSDQMALVTRNILKRLFSYAIQLELLDINPAERIEAKLIASPKSRNRVLSMDEVGQLLRTVYKSNMTRSNKLALHLLMLCMVRKSEMINARWEELDLEKAEWSIPGKRMKMNNAHFVPLSRQAVAMLEELKELSSGSEWVFPSSHSLSKPISESALNQAIRTLECDIEHFTIHDFRRTASTHLHEAGFNSDWIEKALAHETKGVRGVYNRAQYADQRRDMLQEWANIVDNQITEVGNVILGRFGKAYQAG